MLSHSNDERSSSAAWQPGPCFACAATLGGKVHYCPFCGKAQAQAVSTSSAAAPTTADAQQQGSQPSTQTPRPAPTPAPAPAVAQAAAAMPVAAAPAQAQAPATDPTPPTAPTQAPVPAADSKPSSQQAPAGSMIGSQVDEPSSVAQPYTGASNDQLSRKQEEAAPPKNKGKSNKGKWLAIAAGIGAVWYWLGQAPKVDACDQTLTQAQTTAQAGAWPESLALSKNALSLCEDKERKDQATALQKTATTELAKQERARRQEQQRNQQALKEQASCSQAVQNVQRALRERRLQTAERAWQGLNSRCKEQNTALQSDLETQRNQVQQLLGQVTLNMQTNNWEAVAAQLDQISQLNAEQKEVEQWRTQLRRAQEARSVPAAPTYTAPAPSSNEALFREFLRDAERHMNQHQYDRARALLDSANRLVPNHRDVQRLRQRIEAHESRYLSKEIVIE